jgi:hypothetical protein
MNLKRLDFLLILGTVAGGGTTARRCLVRPCYRRRDDGFPNIIDCLARKSISRKK